MKITLELKELRLFLELMAKLMIYLRFNYWRLRIALLLCTYPVYLTYLQESNVTPNLAYLELP